MRQGFSDWLSNVPQQVNEALKSASEWLGDGPAQTGEPGNERQSGGSEGPVLPVSMPSPATEAGSRDGAQRAKAMRDLLARTFGQRMPRDMVLDPLLPLAANPQTFTLVSDLFTILASRGCPCSPQLLAGWGAMASSSRLVTLFDHLIDLVKPQSDEDWGRLYAHLHASWGRPAFDITFQLVDGLAPLQRPLSLASLENLTRLLPTPHACESFLQAVRGFHANEKLSWDELDAVVARYAQDEESAATIGEIGTLLAQRGRHAYRAADLDFLFSELPSRTAVKRYLQAFKILDDYQIRFDEFDAFVTSFARHSEDLEWLQEAVQGLQEAGREVTRLTLVQLREWAPTTVGLKRYVRGVRAFMGSGLTREEIDQFLLPHMESEAKSAVASKIGELGTRVFEGRLTLAKAQALMERLPDRAAVKRYEQAVSLLRQAGWRQADIEVMAPEFAQTSDDAIWLEAFVRNSTEMSRAVERLELYHIRERCPEVTHVYRYFRLRKLFDEFPLISQEEFEAIAFEAIFDEEQGVSLLVEGLVEMGRAAAYTAADLKRLIEAFPGRAGVSRYKLALSTFQGSWKALDDLAITYATNEHRANVMAMVGRSLAVKHLNDVDRNPALGQMIAQVIAKSDRGYKVT